MILRALHPYFQPFNQAKCKDSTIHKHYKHMSSFGHYKTPNDTKHQNSIDKKSSRQLSNIQQIKTVKQNANDPNRTSDPK